MNTFNHFLNTKACREKWSSLQDPGFARLQQANIKSLTALLRWYRERHPRDYRGYSILTDGSGRERLQRLWADYLAWKESNNHEAR
jgi:hypothetical protein